MVLFLYLKIYYYFIYQYYDIINNNNIIYYYFIFKNTYIISTEKLNVCLPGQSCSCYQRSPPIHLTSLYLMVNKVHVPALLDPTTHRDQVSRVPYTRCRWKKKTWRSVGEQGRSASALREG